MFLYFYPNYPVCKSHPYGTTLQFDRQLYSMYLSRKQPDFIANVRRYSCKVSDCNRF